MQKNYLPEGMLPQEQLFQYTSSESGMARAMESGTILQGTVTRCDKFHNLYCDIGPFKGVISRAEATGEGGSKEIAVISKVGKQVCFKVIGIEKGVYILSRRAAQKEAMDYFMENLMPGDVVRGKVTHIEPFGAFVDIGCGNVSLIGIENISVSRISSPYDRFKAGQEIYCASSMSTGAKGASP